MIDLINLPNGSSWSGTIRKDEAGRLHIAGTFEAAPAVAKEEPVMTWPALTSEMPGDLFALENAVPKPRRVGFQGETNPRARLNETQVKFIRASKERTADLAKAFGISLTHVGDIRAGKRWKSLP